MPTGATTTPVSSKHHCLHTLCPCKQALTRAQGYWWRNIDRENRYCNLCKQLLPKYSMKRHNVVKFFELLSTKKQSLLRKLWIFIKHINKVCCTHCCSLTYVYFVNILVMLLLCCYFSLYHCIWLYENKDIYGILFDVFSVSIIVIMLPAIWRMVNICFWNSCYFYCMLKWFIMSYVTSVHKWSI
jgi:hypothetical protein